MVRPRPTVEALEATCREVLCDAPDSVQAVFLYGSSLGPGLRPDSDVDIAVLDAAENRLTWSEQAHLADRLERAVGRPVDLRMLRDGSASYRFHVLRQGRLLWARDSGEVARYSRDTLASEGAVRRRAEEEWPRILHRLANASPGR